MTSWMARGLCREDPDAWFSDEPADVAKAIAVCGQCPVRSWCREYARQHRPRWGVWAGVDRSQPQPREPEQEQEQVAI